jgi:hypothetical protein
MGKLWARWKRNGNAEVVKAAGLSIVAIGILVLLVIISPGGIELFDTLKGM